MKWIFIEEYKKSMIFANGYDRRITDETGKIIAEYKTRTYIN